MSEALHVPPFFAQLADPFSDDTVHLHTSFESARAAAGLPQLTSRPGPLFGWPPAGSLRIVDSLASHGRSILAHRDAARQAEAAAKLQQKAATEAASAAAGSSGSRPCWLPRLRSASASPDASSTGSASSGQHAPLPPQPPPRWQRFSETPPPGLPRLTSLSLGIALKLLKSHPAHALLVPDASQVRAAALRWQQPTFHV